MKLLPVLLACALLSVRSLVAQEAADRTLPQISEIPDVPLIPDEVPQTSKPRGTAIDRPENGGSFKKSKTDISNEELKDRIRFREAKTKALRDAQVQAQWERAATAKTDYEKREALKSYYKLLYARMAKVDASVKKLVDQRQQFALRRLEQTRIDPTQPLDSLANGE